MRCHFYGTPSIQGKKRWHLLLMEEDVLASGSYVETCASSFTNMESQRDSEELVASLQPGLADVMPTIATCQATMASKIEVVQLDMGLLQ